MDFEFFNQFEETQFVEHTAFMFAEIVKQDATLHEVFSYISKNSGVTIKEIVENVVVTRPIKKLSGDKYIFEKSHTNINRKAAEKCVDHLMFMSLCFERPMKPYKFISNTVRGNQVFQALTT
ncbi:hypothetical protein [Metabacillus iocasae]|uniref:Uncharacterized protein n=1 Tax=Priestia iocasae TaxID=2291674 RepID=A0ABS2QYY9_9BACI|nr:hypothetical protein [Metabacillus iocasae]MBM7703921.1 hypothetical protein [Metabacillus iocasae]